MTRRSEEAARPGGSSRTSRLDRILPWRNHDGNGNGRRPFLGEDRRADPHDPRAIPRLARAHRALQAASRELLPFDGGVGIVPGDVGAEAEGLAEEIRRWVERVHRVDVEDVAA